MATYVLIHGAADSAWYWHLLEAELRNRGHDIVAPDLPCGRGGAGCDTSCWITRGFGESCGVWLPFMSAATRALVGSAL